MTDYVRPWGFETLQNLWTAHGGVSLYHNLVSNYLFEGKGKKGGAGRNGGAGRELVRAGNLLTLKTCLQRCRVCGIVAVLDRVWPLQLDTLTWVDRCWWVMAEGRDDMLDVKRPRGWEEGGAEIELGCGQGSWFRWWVCVSELVPGYRVRWMVVEKSEED